MYLAQQKIGNELHFLIRLSYWDGSGWRSRDLVDLGPDPTVHLIYEGPLGFFLDQTIEQAIRSSGVTPGPGELESVLAPFLPAGLRHRFERLCRPQGKTSLARLSYDEEKRLIAQIHPFDKRRLHFLRHGQLDLSRINALPIRYFQSLADKSRDELEQGFLIKEVYLPMAEYKDYIYASLDLQRFFVSPHARRFPQYLDQERLKIVMHEQLTAIDCDPHYWMGQPPEHQDLHEYLARYANMFLAYDFRPENPRQEYVRGFINSHRRQVWPRPAGLSTPEVEELFGKDLNELKAMSRKQLRRLFKKRAQKLHPDKGGDHESFIRLTRAYERLLRLSR